MSRFPHPHTLDSTLSLLRNPYGFISSTSQQLGTDIFETRLLLERTICLTGSDAAEFFYSSSELIREGAVPGRIVKTLFGTGGVQGLDDQQHRHRKQMFMSLMTPKRIKELMQKIHAGWRQCAAQWQRQSSVVLYKSLHHLLLKSACDWAGVPLADHEVSHRSKQVAYLFDRAGAIGPRHWTARLARKQTNEWMAKIIDQIRSGSLSPPHESASAIIAFHQDLNGQVLDRNVAAVELLNIIRPIVAISVYIVFVALSIHKHPEMRERIRQGDIEFLNSFVQEVRRYYPFFPFVGARARSAFRWRDYDFAENQLVLLDLYGTNHDPQIWDAPDVFAPERFERKKVQAFEFIPQGGGDYIANHRCAGEWATVEAMKQAASFLSTAVTYEVPDQNLKIQRTRLPALPTSKFRIKNLKLVDD